MGKRGTYLSSSFLEEDLLNMLEALIIFFIFFLPFQFALQPSAEIDLASVRVLATGIFLWWSAESFFKKNFILPRSLPLFFFTAFLFWASSSFLWAENSLWAWRKILFLLSFFPLFLVFFATFRDQRSREKIFTALVSGATLAALVALLQFFSQWWLGMERVWAFWTREVLPFFLGSAFSETVANYSSLLVNISGATVLRASGFFPDPHIAALFFGMSLPITFWLVGESAGARRKYWCLCAMIILLADLFTFSRGGYVGLIFGASVFFLALLLRGMEWKKQFIKISLGGLVIAAILASPVGVRLLSIFASDDGSKIERVRLWREAVELAALRPLIGVGLGNYPLVVKPSANYREPFYAHNLFLDVALETGLIGFLFFATLLFLGGLYAWKKWRRDRDLFALALLSSLIIFFAHSFFETPLFSVHILPIFLLLMAGSVSLEGGNEKIS